MAPDALFQLEQARAALGPRFVLGPLELKVEEGQTLVLLGPSGCGKSSLLRLLLGLLPLQGGELRFRGAPLASLNLRQLRRRMGYLAQGGGLFPHLTARGNVALMAQWAGMTRSWVEGRTAELTSLTRFPEEALGRYPAELSGGQRQRVGLMRALMLDPEVLLLDEPLGALDPITRFELQNDLHAAFSRLEKTVILVTHDLSEAAFFADQVVLMREGRAVQTGTIQSLFQAPADPFVERFVQAQRPRLEFSQEEKR